MDWEKRANTGRLDNKERARQTAKTGRVDNENEARAGWIMKMKQGQGG